MKRILPLLLLLLIPTVQAINTYSLIRDMNWSGDTNFLIGTDCPEKSDYFKEGDIVQIKSIACLDLNCFQISLQQFVYKKHCSHEKTIVLKLSPDKNVGIFQFAKKRQDIDWQLVNQQVYSKKQIPLFSEQQKFHALPFLPQTNYFFLFPIGAILCIATLIMMRFSKRKIVFPLFITSIILIVISLIL